MTPEALTPRASGTTLQCPLCGCRFDPELLVCRSCCAASGHCEVVCCPNCSLTFLPPRQQRPPRPGKVGRFRRWLWRRTNARS
jgi:hypothetical protein